MLKLAEDAHLFDRGNVRTGGRKGRRAWSLAWSLEDFQIQLFHSNFTNHHIRVGSTFEKRLKNFDFVTHCGIGFGIITYSATEQL